MPKKKKTSDAVEILHRREYQGRPRRLLPPAETKGAAGGRGHPSLLGCGLAVGSVRRDLPPPPHNRPRVSRVSQRPIAAWRKRFAVAPARPKVAGDAALQ